MNRPARVFPAFIMPFLIAAVALSQSPARDAKGEKENASSIKGRVTIGSKAASGVTVALLPAEPTLSRAPSIKTTADEDGRYRFPNVQAGRYSVAPIAPTFIVPQDSGSWQVGRLVTVAEGEAVEGLDFALVRGGVITGRVTDGEGRPVIEEEVSVLQVDERGQKLGSQKYTPFGFQTDDRGVYRIYGLAAGRYIVSVGEAADSGSVRWGYGGGFHKQTFHPNVTDQSRAAIVEVTPGAEAARIDIVVAAASRSYTASGRMIDADTGKPITNAQYAHGSVIEGRSIGSLAWSGKRTNERGEFRIEGLTPGHYAAFLIADNQSDSYGEPAQFEVVDEDVKGIEIKVRRGASISGVAVVEGASDPEVMARLGSLQLFPIVVNEEQLGLDPPRMMPVRIAPDGSFRVMGLRGGKVRLWLGGMPNETKGFSILRVERDGRDVRDGIELAAGEQVTNVKLVIAYGTSVIRGQVRIEGGELSDDLVMRVQAKRVGDQANTGYPVTVDARRRFALEGLSAGDYEVELFVIPADYNAPFPRIAPVKQRVTVPQSGSVEITLTLNLAAREKDN